MGFRGPFKSRAISSMESAASFANVCDIVPLSGAMNTVMHDCVRVAVPVKKGMDARNTFVMHVVNGRWTGVNTATTLELDFVLPLPHLNVCATRIAAVDWIAMKSCLRIVRSGDVSSVALLPGVMPMAIQMSVENACTRTVNWVVAFCNVVDVARRHQGIRNVTFIVVFVHLASVCKMQEWNASALDVWAVVMSRGVDYMETLLHVVVVLLRRMLVVVATYFVTSVANAEGGNAMVVGYTATNVNCATIKGPKVVVRVDVTGVATPSGAVLTGTHNCVMRVEM